MTQLAFATIIYTGVFTSLPFRPLMPVLDSVAEIGYDGIELAAASPHAYPPYLEASDRAKIKRELAARGLGIAGVDACCPAGPAGLNASSPCAAEREAHVEYIRGCLELASDLEAPKVVWPGGPLEYGQKRAEAYELAAGCLRECAAIAEPLGVRLALEAPAEIANLFENIDDLLRLMDLAGVDARTTGVLVDTLPLLYRNDDLGAALLEAGDHLLGVHLQDRDQYPPGTYTNFRSFLSDLQRMGYDGWLTVEAAYGRREPDPDGVARAAFEHLKPILADLGSTAAGDGR